MSSGNRIPVITINREYGAGGRTIAKGLSERFGIPWYDQDIITEIARDTGYSEEDIQNAGERLSKFDLFIDSFPGSSINYVSIHDNIFEVQKNEILKLAEKPCIIVGRLSNVILKSENIETFDIFLYADFEKRMKHIGELGENGSHDLKKFVEKRDALRSNYYKHYSGNNFNSCHNNDICIDTGRIPKEKIIDIISEAIRSYGIE